MPIVIKYAFCSVKGAITANVFASPADAEDWADRLSKAAPGTLYMQEETCWIPVMVFGLPDDDESVLARGMAFVEAMGGKDYIEALRGYIDCEDLPEDLKETLRSEISE